MGIFQKEACSDKSSQYGCFGKKSLVLNEAIRPFGFTYLPEQDIITSALDAWQREFGYCTFFDETAPHFNMVFDCEPVYFDYDDRTWLIEFWKGQYGINSGGEIGVYQADSVIAPWKRWDTLFHSVPDSEMLEFSMELHKGGKELFRTEQKHWWLTGFCVGAYSEPDRLVMKSTVTFPDKEMLCCFLDGLSELGYKEENFLCNRQNGLLDIRFSALQTAVLLSSLAALPETVEKQIFLPRIFMGGQTLSGYGGQNAVSLFLLPPVFRCLFRFRKTGAHKFSGKGRKR